MSVIFDAWKLVPGQAATPYLWDVAKLVLSALIAGLGAWFGGRLSIRREMEKLRRERAFDHRLDWYRRAARWVVENQWFLMNYSKAVSAGDIARAKDLDQKRQANKIQGEGDMREMVFYASRETLAALNRANTRAGKVLKDSGLGIEAAEAAVRELNQAYFVLANDVREHLGIERLTVADVNTNTEAQSESLRGRHLL